jgi:bacteriocin-like protein
MINHIDDNNNDAKNDVTIVGTDFFTDSESFLNELTDDELEQVKGGGGHGGANSGVSLLGCGPGNSTATYLLCL